MAQELRHIERIYDDEADVRTNLDAAQSAILTDLNEEWVYKNHAKTRMYYMSNQYYWDGAAITYCDTEHDDVYAHGELYVGENIYHDTDTDTRIRMGDDNICFYAGAAYLMALIEDAQDVIYLNPGAGDVDVQIDSAVGATFFSEGSSGNVTINYDSEDCDLTVNWDSGVSLFVRGSDGVVNVMGTSAPAWDTSVYDVLVIGDNTAWAVLPDAGGYGHTAELVANAYYDVANGRWEYGDAAAYASRYSIDGCDSTQYHSWYMATMGSSAGDPITWVEVMKINGNGSAGNLIINEDGVNFDVRIETNGDDYMLFSDGGADKLCVSTDTPLAAKLTILQDDPSGESCLALSQGDESEGFIDFVGSDRGPVDLTGGCSVGSVRAELNGTVLTIPLMANQ